MFRFLACFLTTLLAAGDVSADPLPTVRVSVYCFRYAPRLETVHLRSNAETFAKTELSTANIVGPEQAVVENQSVTFHREVVATDGAKPTYPPVCRVRIPEKCPKVLVLLMPSPAGGELPYRGIAFAHTDADFPLGSVKLVNLSAYPVRGAVGKDTLEVASGKTTDFKPTGDPGESLPVLFQFRRNDRWQRMTATRWTLRDDRRFLMCAYEDPATGRMHLRSIPDRTSG